MRCFLVALLLIPSSTWAHGPVAQQASKAVEKSVALYLQEANRDDDKFKSVSAVMIGDERFEVQIARQDAATVSYECGLDTKVKPVKWGCKKK